MTAYPDTSYLCALYRQQDNSQRAAEYLAGLDEPLAITSLVHYEFVNGVRVEIFRHAADHTRGYSEIGGLAMLAEFELHLERGILSATPFDATAVLREAIRLSEAYTIRKGTRSFDLLHVATALVLGAHEFLSFDANQRSLAQSEGLVIPV